MTIKQQGGIFGRNPSFNEVEVKDISVTRTLANGENADVLIGSAGRSDVLATIAVARESTSTRVGWVFKTTAGAGNLATAFTATSDGNIAFPSGQGIDFSATSGTGTSELFDDYEEGTWTPSIGAASGTSITFTAVSATYTKIGRTVHFRAYFNGGFTSAGGYQLITGLPFAPSDDQAGSWSSSAVASGVGGEVRVRTTSDFYIYAPSATVSSGTTIFVYVTGTYQTS